MLPIQPKAGSGMANHLSLTDGRTSRPPWHQDSDPVIGGVCYSARTAGMGTRPPWRRHARSQTPPRLPRRPAPAGKWRMCPCNGSGPWTGSARARARVSAWGSAVAVAAAQRETRQTAYHSASSLPPPNSPAGWLCSLTSESVDKLAPLDRLEEAPSLSERAASYRDPGILRPPWPPFLVALARPGVHTARWRSVRIWID
jgi:hypothetical protein